MTLFGKVLVLLNAALSLGMAAWALALYGARVDWSNKAGKDGKPDGQLVARVAKVKELNTALQAAQPARTTAKATVAAYDQRLFQNRRWYEKELDHARTGATPADPVRTAAFNNGQVQLDPQTGLPALAKATDRSGKPLGSLRYYDGEGKSAGEAFARQSADLDAQIKKDTENTILLAGDADAGKKGLQKELNEEKDKHKGVVAEQDEVRPQLINALVETELVEKRQKALESRIGELKKEGVAAK